MLVADRDGPAVPYALASLADRGIFFVGPGSEVYEGMIVGANNRDSDLPVNVCRAKKMTNIRAASADKTVVLKPARELSLEAMLEYIEEDEWMEVTPGSCRLRKRILDSTTRKRAGRDAAKGR